jgi:electron transport complex protein RnfC
VESFSGGELLETIKRSGIVGMGGAAFPTHVKLSPPKEKNVDTVIVNGAECEPYLTCDHRMMVEKSVEILKGLEIVVKILGVKNVVIAIEDNKQSAIYAMERALKTSSFSFPTPKVGILKTGYPQGAEKQIIRILLGRIVPAGGLPMDVGCIAMNVGTIFSVYEAVYFGKPFIERAVTVTGRAVKDPTNIFVRTGTLISDLVEAVGGLSAEASKVIVGGPMMGMSQYTLDLPIVKGTNGIVLFTKEDLLHDKELACIRCGGCIEVCPIGLVPTTLMNLVKVNNFSEAQAKGIKDCFECGACAFDCPSKIPLVDYMKYGKAKISS